MLIRYQNRFHISASPSDGGGDNCALCLVALPPKYESKICKKCFEKHNNHSKYATYSKEADIPAKETSSKSNIEILTEHHCNLCKKPAFTTATELEEHLIEHSFRGCEERGYNCYICSAIFTLPCGLHQHMIIEHGPSYRPYDCSLCAKKFYFRAELENHVIDHDSGRINSTTTHVKSNTITHTANGMKQEQNQLIDSNDDSDSEKLHSPDTNIKSESRQYSAEPNTEEEDEYIEVEQIAESISVNGEENNHLKSPEVDDQNEKLHEKDNFTDDL